MTMIDTSNNVAGAAATAASSGTLPGQQLTQQDFLKLMVEQFQAQDPTQPMDTSQMVGQMAQFSQIAATQQMQSSFTQLATALEGNQVLSASSLIGRQVLVPATQVSLTSNGIDGAVNVPTGGASDVQVTITDSSGHAVRTLDLGQQPAGLAQFHWDGRDSAGDTLPAGAYQFTAANGNNPLDTYISGTVTGIDDTGNGANVQVGGVGPTPVNQIAQIL